jgi:hypothetical protein
VEPGTFYFQVRHACVSLCYSLGACRKPAPFRNSPVAHLFYILHHP